MEVYSPQQKIELPLPGSSIFLLAIKLTSKRGHTLSNDIIERRDPFYGKSKLLCKAQHRLVQLD